MGLVMRMPTLYFALLLPAVRCYSRNIYLSCRVHQTSYACANWPKTPAPVERSAPERPRDTSTSTELFSVIRLAIPLMPSAVMERTGPPFAVAFR